MAKTPILSRREFLGQLAIGGGALAAASCKPRARKPVEPNGKSLEGQELALCAAACDRLFPADRDPGAVELGVVDYIDARLARSGRRVTQARRRFQRGLALLRDWTQERQGKDFTLLKPAAQDIELASFAAESGDEGFAFVRQLVRLTLEGVFADPIYGGNRGSAGWKIIGFEAPCPNPRCQ